MKSVTFLTGGCRSGKSGHAQALAEAAPAKRRVYIATCVPRDDEMKDRVQKHQADRDERWITREEPIMLPRAIREEAGQDDVVLVDCLTLWLTNLLIDPAQSEKIEEHVADLVDALNRSEGAIFIVSNEVGQGIVPENALARTFRDMAGFCNQRVAAAADKVVWMVAGIPVHIK